MEHRRGTSFNCSLDSAGGNTQTTLELNLKL